MAEYLMGSLFLISNTSDSGDLEISSVDRSTTGGSNTGCTIMSVKTEAVPSDLGILLGWWWTAPFYSFVGAWIDAFALGTLENKLLNLRNSCQSVTSLTVRKCFR